MLSLPEQITIEGWIRLEEPSPGGMIAGRRREGDPFVDFVVRLNGNGRSLIVERGGGVAGTYRTVAGTTELSIGRWHHVAATSDGQTVRVFVDGTLDGSGPASGSIPAAGDEPFRVGSYLLGSMRQLRVWKRALGAIELATVSLRRINVSDVDVIHDWRMDTGSGDVIRDDVETGGVDLAMGVDPGTDEDDPIWARTALVDAGPFFVLERFRVAPDDCWTRSGEERCPNIAALVDFDQDGDLDVVATRSDFSFVPTPLAAFRNDGGAVTEASASVFPVPVHTIASGFAVADVDGDGNADLFVPELGPDVPPFPGGQSRLLMGTATGQFFDETTTRLPLVDAFTHSASFADIDGDGDLDLFVGNICCGPDPSLYINDGTGHFVAEPQRLPAALRTEHVDGTYTTAFFLDVDQDGDQDLVLGLFGAGMPERKRDLLLLNDGAGHFSPAPEERMPLHTLEPEAITGMYQSADFNRDGWADLVMWQTTLEPPATRIALYLSDRQGGFTDATDRIEQPRAILDRFYLLQSIWAADVNQDGWPDLFVEVGLNRPAVLLNLGGYFHDVSEIIPARVGFVNAFMPADLDLDGDIDIYAHAGPWAFALRNVKPVTADLLRGPRRRAVRGGP